MAANCFNQVTELDVSLKIGQVREKTGETCKIIQKLEQLQEIFNIKCHERRQLEGYIQFQRTQEGVNVKKFDARKEHLDNELRRRLTELMRLIKDTEDKFEINLATLSNVHNLVLNDYLTQWQCQQQFGDRNVNGVNLDHIQSHCQVLAELILDSRQQLKRVEILKNNLRLYIRPGNDPGQQDKIILLQAKVSDLLSSLLTSSFVVEKQPPQVLMKNSKFETIARLLVGGSLNIHMTPPKVSVSIISEAQAQLLYSQQSCGNSGLMLNHEGTMQFDQITRKLAVHFKNLQLKNIIRPGKKGEELVTDQKFCLLFQSQFTVGEKDLLVKIWKLSLPIVVTVHVSQESHALATIVWDNAFGLSRTRPFQVPDSVPWSRFTQLLQGKFQAITGRGLGQNHLEFLKEKILGTTPGQGLNSDPDPIVTWTRFCKEPLMDKTFSFWDWLYAIMKLIGEHLRGPWNDGSILGFVGKQQAEEMVSTCPNGTFLLRFSDSELGGITICWVHSNQKVLSLSPFTSKELTARPLSDALNDIKFLTYLYPDVPKSQAFEKYYGLVQAPPPKNLNKGYVGFQTKVSVNQAGEPGNLNEGRYTQEVLSPENWVEGSPQHLGSSPFDFSVLDQELDGEWAMDFDIGNLVLEDDSYLGQVDVDEIINNLGY